ncbi:anchored repeat ABC transporter substrate-binding protein [Streptomyces sp. SAI-133]|uniref:anchored repeat ABC transporter, substrate-binding protein n=1 Tax=unclassified Streptomyces TaxID=2593676 RepID=UPI0024764D35|nr:MULTISPECIES: anchored repeat ABC transporter, substrate-binding protein [unclassified Streptomyces]MDH6546293.1 anchored repeat ABC transporter substrate-binding protein [Streptomyces sp. SAI-041]MDH6589694.1 anchored repeat ABC transporter substrate-binding protein [Streptomyces sp. SAI-133]
MWGHPTRTNATVVSLVAAGALLTGCSGPQAGSHDAKLTVSATTGIIADLVEQVGGDRVDVTSIVPHHGDPHSYEPSPGDAAEVAKADVVFSNGLLLEEPGIMKMVHSNARKSTPKIEIAEKLEQYGGTVIKLEEDLGLDVLWLGWAVEGEVAEEGSQVRTTATKLEGPGELRVYLTDTLGRPKVYVDSADGLDDADSFTLPPEAHTHVNWAFSKPGTYRLTVEGRTETLDGKTEGIGSGTFTFTVGDGDGDGDGAEASAGARVLGSGHADVTLNAETGQVYVRADDAKSGEPVRLPADEVVLNVPDRAKEAVPQEEPYAFLGAAGDELWVLPQAVIGKHVHGDMDPHAWADVANAQAYVRRIEAELVKADPDGKPTYEKNAAAYLKRLGALDEEVAEKLATVPEQNRKLITTHDAFGYLAKAYGMEVAGFVVPVPNQEPSAAEVEQLGDTIREKKVPSVFLEPNLAARADVLRRVAEDEGVAICTIYGDSFDDKVHDYVSMMRHNAAELAKCLRRDA